MDSEDAILDELNRSGIVALPWRFDDVGEFVDHLSRCPAYRDHVRQGKPDAVPIGSYPWTCHDMADVTCAPGLLEAAIDVMPIAASYLEAPPLLYSLNAFYYEPNAMPRSDTQEWHRDADDVRFLAMFIYGTDVADDGDGPHQFMRGTQQGRSGAGAVETVLGPAGTMFLADTSGLHRGLVPRRGRRMLAWARWGVSDPPASYKWDGLQPMPAGMIGDRYPADPNIQQAIRLVVR